MRISDWSSDVCSSDLSITAMLQEAIDRGQRDSVATKRLAEVSAILACQHHMRTQLSLPARSVRTQGIVKVGPAVLAMLDHPERSEERRVGKECVSTCRYRWSPYH